MTIAFVCPNGHQLNAPKTLAGKPGKCPKCGTKFLVPTLEELEAANAPEAETQTEDAPAEEAPISDSRSVKPESAINSSGPSADKPASRFKEVFVFLCPNGHRLNGPPSLKGKAGQCPHCGEKFIIPMDDADAPGPEEEEDVPTGEVYEDQEPEQQEAPEETADEPQEEPAEETPEEAVEEEAPVEMVPTWHLPPPDQMGGHRLAELFTWYWAQRDADVVIELIMKDGQLFTPKLFAPELSQYQYGVFAMQNEDGKYTMTTIAWENVAKIVLNNLNEIPFALFE